MLDYVITGTPRSSTGYMAKLFTCAGIPCGHEQIYFVNKNKLHRVNRPQAESSWLAVPYLYKHDNIIHIVRDPLKVISSMMNADFLRKGNGDIEYIAKLLPDIVNYEGIEQYAYFWTEWNKEIDKHTDKRYNIENINKSPRHFIAQFIEPKMLFISEKYNHWGDYELKTLKDIPKGQVKDNFIKLKEKYGY